MAVNKPFVTLLCALTVMATVNMVIATGPMIQKVFVTNWPMGTNATVTNRNLNVTVTNPPTVNLNISPGKPALDRRVDATVYSVPGKTWYDNITVDVKGYRGLAVGVHILLGSSYIIDQSQPYDTYLAGYGSTTIIYYNYSFGYASLYLASGPIGGLAEFGILDYGNLRYCYGDANSPCRDSSSAWYSGHTQETFFADGVRALGPTLIAHVFYYRFVYSGFYYADCSPLVRGNPPQYCSSLWGTIISGYTQNDSTTATVTVYATE